MNSAARSRFTQWPGLSRICLRQVHAGRHLRTEAAFQGPDAHGEQIWVFSHRRSDQIIYSFDETLNVRLFLHLPQASNSILLVLMIIAGLPFPQTAPFQWQKNEAGKVPQGLLVTDGLDTISTWSS